MVFTPEQWNLIQKEELAVSAAPIGPSELGQNAKYIFALPARYNYAFPVGFEEVQTIINFLVDLFRRYDLSATTINLDLDQTSPFKFLWARLESADPIQAFQTEGGFMTGMLTVHYAYTRETDALTGRYL